MSDKTENNAVADSGNTQEIPVVSASEKQGDSVPSAKNVKLKAIKKIPKWAKVAVIIVVILALVFTVIGIKRLGKSNEAEIKGSDYTVAKGDVAVTISGSGSVAAIDQYDVKPLVRGEIISCTIEEGSQVNKGDVLYTIDSADALNSIERAQNSLEKAQMTYDDALENIEKLNVTSPINGIITAVYINEGEKISNGGKIMDITDNSTMTLELPFISTDADLIRVGDSATVTIEGSYYTMNGTVARISSGTSVSNEGVEVKTVEISVVNPGSLTSASSATAIVGTIACHSAGYFSSNEVKTIYAETSGEVIYQPYEVGDAAKKGDVLLSISDKDASKTLKNAKISLSDARLSLENAQKTLDDYTITAPISGQVVQKESKAGDKLDNSNSSVTMCTIADLSKIVFEISVDELDISKLKVGMEATITADAIENRKFSGVVDHVSSLGTTSNGVTSYPVRVHILDPEGLVIGMNVDAEIIVEEVTDVITVPVNAVKRGNIVYRKKTVDGEKTVSEKLKNSIPEKAAMSQDGAIGKQGSNTPLQGGQNTASGQSIGNMTGGTNGKNPFTANIPDGYEPVRVEVGLNNDSFIEVKSGLSVGDIIWVETVETTSTNMMFPMGGMPGGGMPGGGMGGPPGGMSGGMSGGGMR